MASVKRAKTGTVLTPEMEEAPWPTKLRRATKSRWPARSTLDVRPLARGVSPRLELRVEPGLAKALHKRASEERRHVRAVAALDALRRYLAP
jgi:hypothetical protein